MSAIAANANNIAPRFPVSQSAEAGPTGSASSLRAVPSTSPALAPRAANIDNPLPLPPLPKVSMTEEQRVGAESFATQLDVALGEALSNVEAEGWRGNLENLPADALIAAFLKLNVIDQSNTALTHNLLHEVASELRKQAIDEAQVKERRATEQMKKAEKAQEKAMFLQTMVAIVVVIVGIIVTVATWGAGTAAWAVAAKLAFAAFSATAGTAAAVNTNNAANKMADAKSSQNGAKRHQAYAEQFQAQIESESEIIKTLMESKNKAVDAVMKMLQAGFNSQNKMMSAAMAR